MTKVLCPTGAASLSMQEPKISYQSPSVFCRDVEVHKVLGEKSQRLRNRLMYVC